jgi:hypothetical protein
MTIWRMRVAYWKRKATNTHSQYGILIAFPLQPWLQEHASCHVTRTLPVFVCLFVCLCVSVCPWHLLRYLGLDRSSLICIPQAIKQVRVRWAGPDRCIHGFSGVGWRRPLRRPRCRWGDNIQMDREETGWDGLDLIDLYPVKDKWRVFVDTVMNLRFPEMWGNLLNC